MLAFGPGSTTPLAANGTVVAGEWNLVGNALRHFSTVRGMASADQAGTLAVRQSLDGVTWVTTKSVAVVAGTPNTIADNIVAPWVEVLYTNGATLQGSFVCSASIAP